jgi:hypothetical protein
LAESSNRASKNQKKKKNEQDEIYTYYSVVVQNLHLVPGPPLPFHARTSTPPVCFPSRTSFGPESVRPASQSGRRDGRLVVQKRIKRTKRPRW